MKKIIALTSIVLLVLVVYWLSKSQNTTDQEPQLTPQHAKATEQNTSKSKASARATSSAAPVHEAVEIEFDEDPKGNIRLEGQVLDERNLPVEKALVTIDTRPEKKTTTDRGGSFSFGGLAARRYRLSARKDSEVGGPLSYLLTETSDPAIIHLRAGSTLEIKVVSEQRAEAVQGARVELRGSENRPAVTDGKGMANFEGVPGGSITISVKAEGFCPSTQLINIPDPAGSEAIRLTVMLQNGLSVQGRVVDEQGEPISNAKVLAINTARLFDLQDEDRDGTLTDTNGRFVFQALAKGSYRLFASHPKHPKASSKLFNLGNRPVKDVVIVMEAGGQVSGIVTRSDGEPAPWASVRIGSKDVSLATKLSKGMIHRGVTADNQGRFHFEGLPRKKLLVVAVGQKASSKSVLLDLEARSSIDDVRLVLDLVASISGTVQTSGGEPVPEVEVIATPDIWEEGIGEDFHLRGRAYAMTNGGGEFILSGLAEGTYRLHASRSRGAAKRMFTPGQKARTGDKNVVLILDAAGGVKGSLVFDDGSVPDAFSVAVGLSSSVAFSGGSGTFEISQIPSGVYTVSIRGESFAEKTIPDVKVEPENITDLGTIRLARGRTITGLVLDEKENAIAGANVLIAKRLIGDGSKLSTDLGSDFAEKNGQQQTLSGQDGSFRFVGLPYKKLVIVAEHEKLGRSLPLAIDSTTPNPYVELVVKGLGSLFGKVTSDGKPVSGAIVSVGAASGGSQALVVYTDKDGTYHIEKISTGLHKVTATIMSSGGLGAKTQSGQVDILPGEQNSLNLDIPTGQVELTIQIVGVNGAVISAAQVFLLPGQVEITNSGQLEKIASSGGIMMSFWMPARPAVFQKVIPGDYSICVVPISGDMNDLAFLQKLQEHRSDLLVHCEHFPIEPTPEKQSTTMSTPPMLPLESGTEQADDLQPANPGQVRSK